MFLAPHESATLFLDAFVIALKHGAADIFAFEGQVAGFNREMGANGEPHQIDGVSHRPGFVEVVDAPNQAALDVTPCPEVLNMKIAYRENAWSPRQFGTDLGPELRPAVVGGTKERK